MVAKLFESSEEGQKVTRNSGSKWCAVFERVAAPARRRHLTRFCDLLTDLSSPMSHFYFHCFQTMVKIALQFKAYLENVTGLLADGEDFRYDNEAVLKL